MTIALDEGDYAAVQNALSQLSAIEQNAVVKKGLQEGLSIFVKQGKQNLRATLSSKPVNVRMRKGNLMKSFRTNLNKRQSKGYAGFNHLGRHAHLVDSGTKNRWTKSGAYRGSVDGSKFWKTAFEQKKNEAAKELVDSIIESINKIIKYNR